MLLTGTRGTELNFEKELSFSKAILNPLASFGGLYAPKSIPNLGIDFVKKHKESKYKDIAYDLFKIFNIDIDDKILKEALNLYDNFDNPLETVPIVKISNNFFISELYRGPTRAFKDMALQPFGHILSALAKKENKKYLILTATSGDTGPAALSSFANKENISIVCLYPNEGTSDVQRLQMTTMDANNIKVFGINGDFDDAQTALKYLLNSQNFNDILKENNIHLSVANSVNFGRIIFQIIYHIYSYIYLYKLGLRKDNELIDLIVPSGNFGNILGAYYAKKANIPIRNLILSSNSNNVLEEFIKTGIYDIRNKKLIKTYSPAMDILKSSNVERLFFDLYGSKRTKELMYKLENEKFYSLSKEELSKLQGHFKASSCTDEEIKKFIKSSFLKGYLLDPHTATCLKAYYEVGDKNIPTVAYSTAEWTKFSPNILKSLEEESLSKEIDSLYLLAKKSNINIPAKISSLFNKKIVHKAIIEKEEIENKILNFII